VDSGGTGERALPPSTAPVRRPSDVARLAAVLLGLVLVVSAVLAPQAADRWLDEDDEVLGRLPDPYHRVDLRRTGRHIAVTSTDGAVVAEADGGVLLGETGLVDRFYVAREAVTATLEPTDTRTVCPYKGVASWFSVRLDDGRVLTDAAWSYEEPTDESRAIAGLVCFAHDELVVDAVPR
jgi:uncharacterized protein (DUF427 family)